MEMELMILIGGFAIGVGIILSVVYYFARYFVTTDHEEDKTAAGKTPPAALEEKPEPTVRPPPTTGPPQETQASQTQHAPQAPTAPKPRPETTLNQAMSKTRDSFWGRLKAVVVGASLDPDHVEAIEEILYTSDLGPKTVQRLMDSVQERANKIGSLDDLKHAFRAEFENILTPIKSMGESPLTAHSHHPEVWMIVGVNGAGKTTTIGKLSYAAAQKGLKVLVAAGDTFRAAAQEQLKIWTERAQVEIFAPPNVTDPGAVAFDAYQLAKAKNFDLVIIDTAGRLHTQKNLMEELKKVQRVLQKQDAQVPHETLIVLDANSGQNALVQAREFHQALTLTGAVVTKMDGTAKGGVVLGLAEELQLPTRLIGVGEGVTDLKNFSVDEYVSSILG